MKALFFFLATLLILVSTRGGQCTPIGADDVADYVQELRNTAASRETPDASSEGINMLQKRYNGNYYYTNMRGKHSDRNAMKNILRNMFTGKRAWQFPKRDSAVELTKEGHVESNKDTQLSNSFSGKMSDYSDKIALTYLLQLLHDSS